MCDPRNNVAAGLTVLFDLAAGLTAVAQLILLNYTDTCARERAHTLLNNRNLMNLS